MTWFLRVVFVCLPVMGWAEGTRVDRGASTAGLQFDITLTAGLGFDRDDGTAKLRTQAGIAPSGEETVRILLKRKTRIGDRTTYHMVIAEPDRQRAVDFWDAHQGCIDYVPSIPVCRQPDIGTAERIVYKMDRPGFGGTPLQQFSPEKLRAAISDMQTCRDP